MLADELDFVIGVDTHRDAHTLSFLRSPSGARLLEAQLGADKRGYGEALTLALEHAPGRRAWAIEGTGAYGKGLARHLLARGERVYEVERPRRAVRSGRGKSDALDARRAALSLWKESGSRARAGQGHGRPCAACFPPGRARSRPAARP